MSIRGAIRSAIELDEALMAIRACVPPKQGDVAVAEFHRRRRETGMSTDETRQSMLYSIARGEWPPKGAP